MKVKYDMGESENVSYSTKTLSCQRTVEPQSMEFLLHVQPGEGSHSKQFAEEVEQIIKK
jgi:hypothetical protein